MCLIFLPFNDGEKHICKYITYRRVYLRSKKLTSTFGCMGKNIVKPFALYLPSCIN